HIGAVLHQVLLQAAKGGGLQFDLGLCGHDVSPV
ncbi:MAG: hypothetical protein ACI83E_000793, partial [Sulfitobacter sp.]